MSLPLEDRSQSASWKDKLGSWSVYAAAAGATLATASSAEANIIYVHPSSPVEAALGTGPSFTGNQTAKATFKVNSSKLGVRIVNHTALIRRASARLSAYSLFSKNGYLRLFKAGAAITGGRTSTFATALRAFGPKAHATSVSGFFPLNHTGFAGFKTSNGDIGWVRIEVLDRNSDGFPDAIEAVDWAYNSVSGGAINAGEGAPLPEPSSISLALMATGAAGLVAWRRRKSDQRSAKQS